MSERETTAWLQETKTWLEAERARLEAQRDDLQRERDWLDHEWKATSRTLEMVLNTHAWRLAKRWYALTAKLRGHY